MKTRLEFWRRSRNLTYAALGAALGVTERRARSYCQRRGHKDHRWPASDVADALPAATERAITMHNFDDLVDQDHGVVLLGVSGYAAKVRGDLYDADGAPVAQPHLDKARDAV